MNTIRLLFGSAVVYVLLLVLVRGIFPSESTPTLAVTGIPLIAIVIMIARELSRQSTSPTTGRTTATATGFHGNPVQFLSGQFRVAASASSSYFDIVVRARLKELLTAKVALETGLESETVRRLLSDPKQGPQLIEDDSLYRILYGPTPTDGLARMNIIGEAINLIGAWKG